MVEHFLPVAHTNGYAYYCGRCGEVWARLRTVGNGYFSPYSQFCKQHRGESEIDVYGLAPGSLLQPLVCRYGNFEFEFDKLLARLTDEHLEYEFQQALEWAER